MFDQLTVSPLLDGFTVGAPVGEHFGVRCYPAVRAGSQRKYIVKEISIPASQTQLDALLITGAYKDPAEATEYYRSQAESVMQETELLQKLSQLEGFIPYEGCQMESMQKNRIGYQVYLLSGFRLSLDRYMHRHAVSHLEAVNLGIDLCTALAACRDAGMLYVDLKPSNVFISNKKEYKIGDLGFIPMSSLKYTPMPEKYRSSYTAPELLDDLSVVGETADTYSAGMILYQIFNNGVLPEDLTRPLPAPVTADEEMAGILQKACAPDPAERWQEPAQMRQALVDYMQRNTINNVPIMEPLASKAEKQSADSGEQAPAESAAPETASDVPEEAPLPSAPEAAVPPEETPADEPEEAVAPEAAEVPPDEDAPKDVPPEDVPSADEEIPEAQPSPDAEEQASPTAPEAESTEYFGDDFDAAGEEAFAALTGASPDTTPSNTGAATDDLDLDAELAALHKLLRDSEKPIYRERKQPPNVEPVVIKPQKKKKSAVKVLFILFLLCLLLAGSVWGYMYYTGEYLQTVNGITITESNGTLIVQVDSQVEEGLLSVVCADTYGNSFTETVQNGKAEFTDVSAGTFYTIQVQISGLHKLSNPIYQVYTTESVTSVAALNATAGTKDGSVTISMVVEGAEPEKWQIFYSAEDEPELSKTFSGHSITLENLTVGKLYTFRLEIPDGIDHTQANGQSTVQFTPERHILAEDLEVVSFSDGNLTLSWNCSSTTKPEYWIVSCSGDGYDETIQVTTTQAVFTGISQSKAYNVNVTAAGMTQTSRLSISANPVTITNFQVDESDPEELTLSWLIEGTMPEGGWQVIYTLDSSDLPSAVKAEGNTAVVTPRIPGAVYHFSIEASNGTSVFSGIQTYTCPEASDYNAHSVSRSSLTARLLVTPEDSSWATGSISSDLFTETFTLGQSISVLLQNNYGVYLADEEINILYLFRNADGEVSPEMIGEATLTWREIWNDGLTRNAGLDVPITPSSTGEFVLEIYFNGASVASASLTVR